MPFFRDSSDWHSFFTETAFRLSRFFLSEIKDVSCIENRQIAYHVGCIFMVGHLYFVRAIIAFKFVGAISNFLRGIMTMEKIGLNNSLLGPPFYLLREESLKFIRKLVGERNAIFLCHKLHTEFNANDRSDFWLIVKHKEGRLVQVHFNRDDYCRYLSLPKGYYRYGDVYVTNKNEEIFYFGRVERDFYFPIVGEEKG